MTLNADSQAGQVSSRVPGLGLILNVLSQPGQSISTLTILAVREKLPMQAPQVSSTGLSSVPAMTTVLQCGHGRDSSVSESMVGWWLTRQTAPQTLHSVSYTHLTLPTTPYV